MCVEVPAKFTVQVKKGRRDADQLEAEANSIGKVLAQKISINKPPIGFGIYM